MTTHYMEEADQLCDRIAIIDRGSCSRSTRRRSLKAKAPGDTIIDITLDGDSTPLVAEPKTRRA